MDAVYNFSAGPAGLPKAVMELAQKEFVDWNGLGRSVMEISHRSKEFIAVADQAEQDLRDLLSIPDNYKVLFCQGGARAQFSAIPMNLLGDKTKASYIDAGYWAASAVTEAKKYCDVQAFKLLLSAMANMRFCQHLNGKSTQKRPSFTTARTKPSMALRSTTCLRQTFLS